MEQKTYVDLPNYGHVLEDLITTYRILTGLNKVEFRDRFWNNKVKEAYGVFNGCSGIDAKLLNIWEIDDISEENKAIQMMSVTLGWKCVETLDYFQHEIYEIIQSKISNVEKTNVDGKWCSKGTPYEFKHPMYYKSRRRPIEKEAYDEV